MRVPELSEDDVRAIARLAQLALSPEETELMRGELGAVLGHIETLASANTDAVEPMTHAVPMSLRLRDDEVRPSLPAEVAVAQAPDRDGDFFRVPNILGGSGE